MAIEHIFNKDPIPFYIGFTDVDADLRAANEELYRENFDATKFPFHNIFKDGKYFIVEIHTPGYSKEHLDVSVLEDIMSVKGEYPAMPETREMIYQGAMIPATFEKSFRLADNILVDSIEYKDGVLVIKLEKMFVEVRQGSYNIGRRQSDGDFKRKKKDHEEKRVKVNEEKSDVPTTEVVVLDPMPQVVSVEIEKNLANTAEPIVVLKDATNEVKEGDVLVTVPTEAGKSDIVVAIDPVVKEAMEVKGVDVVSVIQDAVVKADVAPELPVEVSVPVNPAVTVENETVVVTAPSVVPQIVEVTKDESKPSDVPAVVVADTSEKISETAVLVPVVTVEGEPNIVMAIEPELKKELEDKGVDVAKEVGEALQKSETEVVTNNQVDPVVNVTIDPVVVSELKDQGIDADKEVTDAVVAAHVEPVSVEVKIEPVVVAEPAPMPVIEPAMPVAVEPVVVNAAAAGETQVKAEVVALDPMPQVVAVEVTANAEGPTSIVMTDATVEVKDNVELVTVPTEAGKSDVVVAVDAESAKVMEEKGIDVVEAVKNAFIAADVAPELPQIVVTETKVETVDIETKAIDVTIPTVVTQIVEVTKDAVQDASTSTVAITVADTSEKVAADAVMVPVVTPEGEPDIVAAVEPALHKELTDKGVDIAKELSEAMVSADVTVDTVVDTIVEIPAPVVEAVKVEEPVVVAEPVVEKAPENAAEVKVDLTNITVANT